MATEIHAGVDENGRIPLLCHLTILTLARLNKEAKLRGVTPEVMAARILTILGRDAIYGAVLDDVTARKPVYD